MESIFKSDIFFFITSVSVIVVTFFVIVAIFYFIKILRNFYKISKLLRESVESTGTELKELGKEIRQSPLFTFIFGKRRVKKENNSSARKSI